MFYFVFYLLHLGVSLNELLGSLPTIQKISQTRWSHQTHDGSAHTFFWVLPIVLQMSPSLPGTSSGCSGEVPLMLVPTELLLDPIQYCVTVFFSIQVICEEPEKLPLHDC